MKLVGSQVKLVIAIVFLYASDNFNMIYNNYKQLFSEAPYTIILRKMFKSLQ